MAKGAGESAERIVKDIRRKTRRRFSAEEKTSLIPGERERFVLQSSPMETPEVSVSLGSVADWTVGGPPLRRTPRILGPSCEANPLPASKPAERAECLQLALNVFAEGLAVGLQEADGVPRRPSFTSSSSRDGQRPFRPLLRRISIQAVSIGRFMTIAWSFFMVST